MLMLQDDQDERIHMHVFIFLPYGTCLLINLNQINSNVIHQDIHQDIFSVYSVK